MIAGAAIFIQSERFAHIVKSLVADKLPSDLGIRGDFSNFGIRFFPPAIAMNNPQIVVGRENIINLPEGSKVKAKKIELRFYPLQLLTGSIRIHEAAVIEGEVDFSIDTKKLKKTKSKKNQGGGFSWDDLIHIKAESVVFEDSQIRFSIVNPSIKGGLSAKYLRVKQVTTGQGGGVELFANIEDIKENFQNNGKFQS